MSMVNGQVMISVTDLRAGTTFVDGRDVFEVLSYKHVKLGRGPANIKVKVRNLRSGAILQKVFLSGSKVDEARLDKRKAQFLFRRGAEYIFMDSDNFEQYSLSKNILAKKARFLSSGTEVILLLNKGEIVATELPVKMEFTVIDTSPGVKGNSATNIWKEATLETGFKVKVPLFISAGDRIRLDTRTGKYVERVSS